MSTTPSAPPLSFNQPDDTEDNADLLSKVKLMLMLMLLCRSWFLVLDDADDDDADDEDAVEVLVIGLLH